MEVINQANKILQELSLPIKAFLNFKDKEIKDFELQNNLVNSDPYLLSVDGNLKIYLRYPFYFSFDNEALIIQNEETFKLLKLSNEFQIINLKISDIQVLEINCSNNFIFLAFAGISYGWGVYLNNQELIQHYGVDEGIELMVKK